MGEIYKISELADKAEVTKRTIHYYISKGLIPPASGSGVASTYDEEHLLKLRLIKKLQEQYLPLERIRELVSGLDQAATRKTLEGEVASQDLQGQVLTPAPPNLPDLAPGAVSTEYDMTQPTSPSLPNIKQAKAYLRVDLGFGIELHYPLETAQKHKDLIASIERYARKLIDEN